ncbi:MAG: LamG domain-containing protein [Planctomycetota bacterium]|jgi:hypothetical protein
MNNENIEEILKGIGDEAVPADVQKIAQETSNNFSKSLTQQQEKPRQHILLEHIMRSRLPKLAAAAVIIVAVFVGLNIPVGNSVAWSKVLENVLDVRAYVHRVQMTISRDNQPETQVEFTMNRSVDYGMRRDFYVDANLAAQLFIGRDVNNCVEVVPPEKKYVKTILTEQQLTEMREKQDPRELVKHLTSFERTSLGNKVIGGRECEGIEVDDPRFARMLFEEGKGRIWADVETELPVLIEIEGTSGGGAIRTRFVLDQFDWAAPLTAEDFEPNIPDDYTLWAEVDLTGNARTVVKGLRGFSNITGGKYPSSLDLITSSSEVQWALLLDRQEQGIPLDQLPSREEMDNILAIQGACKYYGELMSEDKDVAYYGDRVTAEFPHAVLMRWKCGDNDYCIIFGDLSVSNVTPEELAELEAAPLNLNPKPIRPDPADGTEGTALTGCKLRWMAGAYAVEHRIHFGASPDELSLLATTTGTEFDGLPALKRDTTYYWRVDAVSADGKVAEGDLWTLGTGSLVAWYKFDEGSGDSVVDSGPAHIDGENVGDTFWTDDGAIEKALVFDGNDAHVNLGNHPKFNITNQITVSAWIKVNAFDKDYQTIIAKGDNSWRLQRNARTDTLEFACTGLPIPNNPFGGIYGKTNVNDGQWHHAAGTYDGSKISLYVDGALDISAEAKGSIKTNDTAVYIGGNAEKPGRFWNGLIDDVRIYSYALNADEVTALASTK